jgi:WD40 repeat protein
MGIASTSVELTLLAEITDAGEFAWSPDGDLLAAASDSAVWVYDVIDQDFRLRADLPTPSGKIGSLTFSPDGTTLAAGASVPVKTELGDRERAVVYRWDSGSGAPLDTWATEPLNIYATPDSVSYSPGGRWLAYTYSLNSASCLRFSGYLTLWDAQTGDLIPTPMSSGNNTFDVAFSPDETLMAVNEVEDACVPSRSTVTVYRLDDLTPIVTYTSGVPGAIGSLVFSRDSSLLLGSEVLVGSKVPKSAIYLWDAHTLELISG